MQGYLLINPNGSRTWYLRYRFPGKESHISFGAYPTTSLTEARDKQDEARKLIRSEINPSKHRQTQSASVGSASDNIVSFKEVVVAWHTRNLSRWSEGHVSETMPLLEHNVLPVLGSMAKDEIDTLHLAQVIRVVDNRDFMTSPVVYVSI